MANSPYGYTVFAQTGGVVAKLPQIIVDMVAQGATDLRLQLPAYLIDTLGDLNPAHYTWTGLDDAVSRCNAAGINLYFSIMYMYAGGANPSTLFPITSPVGYYTYGITSGGVTQYVPDPTKMATFALQVAQRYNGGVHGTMWAIGPGNEEYNLAGDANGVRDAAGVPAALAMIGCYKQIKTANPGCYVPAPSILRQDETGIQTWITNFFNAGGFPYCDALEFHFYKNGGTTTFPSGIPPDNAPVNFGFTQFWRKMYQTMVSLGVLKPIWLTECGYDALTVAANGTSNTTAFYQQKYLQYELLNAMKSGIIKKFYWYTIGNNDTHSLTQHGQVDGLTETFQPAYYGFQSLIAEHSQSDWEPVKTTTKQLSLSGSATNVLVTGAATTLLLTEK